MFNNIQLIRGHIAAFLFIRIKDEDEDKRTCFGNIGKRKSASLCAPFERQSLRDILLPARTVCLEGEFTVDIIVS